MDFHYKAIDVICHCTTEGDIIPIRIRIRDDEGQYQAYAIKAYKQLSHKGQFTMPNGMIATSTIIPYDVKIIVFGQERLLHIFYNLHDRIWRLSG